jgi:hypothetical protein
MEFSGIQLTIPERLAKDEKGEYQVEKEEIQQCLEDAMSKNADVGGGGALSLKKKKWTWFRLPNDLKRLLLRLYADMVCQMLGLDHRTSDRLKVRFYEFMYFMH